MMLGEYIDLFWPSLVGGVAVALLAAVLSPFVVLKRLAFVGQGVSHAAFGGVGVAVALGATGSTLAAAGAYYGIVGAFCIATAIGIAMLSDERGVARTRRLRPDTVIGVFLVATMALGSILLFWSQRRAGGSGRGIDIDGWLFGSITVVQPRDAWVAVVSCIVIAGVVWAFRRAMLFWAFDGQSARAFGVRVRGSELVLMVLLGVAVVVSMKLAGAVLATALLVLPAAAALQVSARLGVVFAVTAVVSVVSMLGGLVGSALLDVPPGPAIVAALVLVFAGSALVGRIATGRSASAGGETA